MALSGNTLFEVRTTGDDTNGAGAFDPSQTAGMFTDGAASSATGNTPSFSSASYSFVAGDAGAWIYIASGTNWQPGWYQIGSVSGGAAILSAAIGAAVWASAYGDGTSTKIPSLISTVAGCSRNGNASLTGATWTIDYSQQDAAQFTYTDLASAGAGLTVSSAAKPFAKQHVGNSLVITGGTNFTAGRYVIASVAAAVATVVGPGNITTGAGASGTGGQGGALATPGKAASVHVGSNFIFVKSGTYSVTSASTNVAGGCLSLTAGAAVSQATTVSGYGSLRRDYGTKPLLQASGISSFTLITATANWTYTENVSLDGASLTSSRGLNCGSVAGGALRIKAANCTNSGITGQTLVMECEVTGCSTQAAFLSCNTIGCWAHDNTITGFSGCLAAYCIASNNSGASSDGFTTASRAWYFDHCMAYNNGRSGFTWANTGTDPISFYNCLAEANGAYGFASSAAGYLVFMRNCAGYNNTSGNVQAAGFNSPATNIGFVTLTGSAFTNAAGGDFTLNNTSGAGAACRAAAFPGTMPGSSLVGYPDIGALQHQDSGGGGGIKAPLIGPGQLIRN